MIDKATYMTTIHEFASGDYLVFQLESGFALMRVLAVETVDGAPVWHVAAYGDLFLDIDSADAAIDSAEGLQTAIPHAALTNRAFESTQVAKMRNIPLTDHELARYEAWRSSPERHISDRSIRLLLGLR